MRGGEGIFICTHVYAFFPLPNVCDVCVCVGGCSPPRVTAAAAAGCGGVCVGGDGGGIIKINNLFPPSSSPPSLHPSTLKMSAARSDRTKGGRMDDPHQGHTGGGGGGGFCWTQDLKKKWTFFSLSLKIFRKSHWLRKLAETPCST